MKNGLVRILTLGTRGACLALLVLIEICLTGCSGLDDTCPDAVCQSDLSNDLLMQKLFVGSVSKEGMLNAAAAQLEGRTVIVVFDGSSVDRTELEDELLDILSDLTVAFTALADDDTSYVTSLGFWNAALPELQNTISQLCQTGGGLDDFIENVEDSVSSLLETEYYNGGDTDCSKFSIDELSQVEVEIESLELSLDSTDDGSLNIAVGIKNPVVSIETATVWIKHLWCSDSTLDDFQVTLDELTAAIDMSVNFSQGTINFNWPRVGPIQICDDGKSITISGQDVYWPAGLPPESSDTDIPRSIEYTRATVSGDYVIAGHSEQPSLSDISGLSVWEAAVGFALAISQGIDWIVNREDSGGSPAPDPMTGSFIGSLDTKEPYFVIQDLHVQSGTEKYITFNYEVDDVDWDGFLPGKDNCPNETNYDQADADYDGVGDACDTDSDLTIAQLSMGMFYIQERIKWLKRYMCYDWLVPNWEYVFPESIITDHWLKYQLDELFRILDTIGELPVDMWQFVIDETGHLGKNEEVLFVGQAINMAQQNLAAISECANQPSLYGVEFYVADTTDGQRLGWRIEEGAPALTPGAKFLIITTIAPVRVQDRLVLKLR